MRLPSQERKPREVTHGPMESERHGMGRLLLIAIFTASARASTQLLMRNEHAVRGQMTEKSDR